MAGNLELVSRQEITTSVSLLDFDNDTPVGTAVDEINEITEKEL